MISTKTRESRLMLRLVSLLLALLIWFQMSGRVAESEEIQTRSYRPVLEFKVLSTDDIEPKSASLDVAVTISGPDQDIQQLQEQDVRVEVELDKYSAGGSYEVPLVERFVILPEEFKERLKVERIIPSTVRVELVEMTVKSLNVLAFPTGSPAPDHRLVGDIRVTPPRLRVRGPSREVRDLENLITNIDITHASSTKEGFVTFSTDELPEDTVIEYDGDINYTAVIQEIEEERPIAEPEPVVIEDENWASVIEDPKVNVTIKGPISALDWVDPAWVVVRANTRLPDPPVQKIDDQEVPQEEPVEPPVEPDTRIVPVIGRIVIPDDHVFEDPVILDKIYKVRILCDPSEIEIRKVKGE